MKKRVLICLMVAVIALSVVFTACNKDVYVDPSTDSEYILVTDENGKKVLSEDGELLVYVTDADGKKVKDENGEYVTEIRGFVGQIEENGVIEDYAYYFTLPDGWKAVNDRGEFENEGRGVNLKISILEKTYDEYYKTAELIYKELNSENYQEEKGFKPDILWEEKEIEGIASKVGFLGVKNDEVLVMAMFFVQNNNMYEIKWETQKEIDLQKAQQGVIEIFNSIEFKPYTYYPELVETTNNGSFIVEMN